jgi:hypothetical protein
MVLTPFEPPPQAQHTSFATMPMFLYEAPNFSHTLMLVAVLGLWE